MNTAPEVSQFLDVLVDHLDVPKSYYDKAAERHRSVGEWLHRPESKVARFDPDVRPQGSFRYGTVIRPLNDGDEYDLDNVCVLKTLGKPDITQEELKRLYGLEIKAYAKEHGMLAPVTEHKRCWRLQYADEVAFHLDTLPCVPEDGSMVAAIIAAGVSEDFAKRAIAITDRHHPQYAQKTRAWFSSNPRGFARLFEARAALGRRRMVAEGRIKAVVEDVPPYEWKTPLQRSIQILKRHRDVMFQSSPDLAPISMIITNLAASAYHGETDLRLALLKIVADMPRFVRSEKPRVPNPANPAEDYADKWSKDPRLEKCFWDWHYAVKSDLEKLPAVIRNQQVRAFSQKAFAIAVTDRQVETVRAAVIGGALATKAKPSPVLVVPSAAKPWGWYD